MNNVLHETEGSQNSRKKGWLNWFGASQKREHRKHGEKVVSSFSRKGKRDSTYGEVLPGILKDIDTLPTIKLPAHSQAPFEAAPNQTKPFGDRYTDIADIPEPPEEPPFLFGNYLVESSTHWLSGETGIGKSTFIYNLVIALAKGEKLWDVSCKPRKICYIDMENVGYSRQKKIHELLTLDEKEALRGKVKFLDESVLVDFNGFIASVKYETFDLVIFDTARTNFPVNDENDNAEVYNKILPVLTALKVIGTASLVVGHTAKTNKGTARGAGAQGDAVNVILSLVLAKGNIQDADAVIELSVIKNNPLGLGIPPLRLQRVGENKFEPVGQTKPNANQTSLTKKTGKQKICDGAIISLLSSDKKALLHRDIVKAMLEQGFAEGTAKGAIGRLFTNGEIIQDDEKRYLMPVVAEGTEN